VRLFELAIAGGAVAPARRASGTSGGASASLAGPLDDAASLYAWFLPLLRLDVVPKFVQLIKLTQQECAVGSERVRPPRLPLFGAERDAALSLIRGALASRPKN
jgi:4-hydroxy-tetrahydrodipicolinate synthase